MTWRDVGLVYSHLILTITVQGTCNIIILYTHCIIIVHSYYIAITIDVSIYLFLPLVMLASYLVSYLTLLALHTSDAIGLFEYYYYYYFICLLRQRRRRRDF